MAFLPPGVITQRRLDLTNEIVALYHNLDDHLQNQEWYGLMCPCDIDCMCMPYDEVPRLRVSSCYLPGELDYYFVNQPFLNNLGFRVRWHCDECHSEISCGDPDEIIFPFPAAQG